MSTAICPHCNGRLSNRELSDGWCDGCGKKLPSTVTAAAPRRPKAHHHHGAEDEGRIADWMPLIASLLFLLFLVTILVPHGMVSSILLAWSKGGSVCAYPGCTEHAVADVKQDGVIRGYCAAHRDAASSSLPRNPMMWPLILTGVGVLFIGFYAFMFNRMLSRGTDTTGRSIGLGGLMWFVLLSLTGIVGVNGLCWYAARYWC